MDKNNIYYCFTLSEEQMKYLRSKKYRNDRMECFLSMVALAEREKKLVQVCRTQQVEILPGQIMIDNTRLAKLWDKDRKTVPKLLDSMESLGISSSQKVRDNRIHTLHSLTGWYVDGKFLANEYAAKRNADGSGIFHRDVPPARVVIIEDKDTNNEDVDGKGSDTNKSQDCTEDKIPSSTSIASLSLPQSDERD